MPEPKQDRHRTRERRVRLELTDRQINQIVRDVSDVGYISALLAGLGDLSSLVAVGKNPSVNAEGKPYSNALLRGLAVFASLPTDGSGIGVTVIAKQLGISPSTAHRYLHTLRIAGLVDRDALTHEYKLAGLRPEARRDAS